MYQFLKEADHGLGDWHEILAQLEVCTATVYRYIDFWRIIGSYPRLIICELSFELIVSNGKQLTEYFAHDQDLAARLRMPLRTTEVQADKAVFTPNRLPGGGSVEKADLMATNVDWSPSWEFGDLSVDLDY